jgi:hypothetical protein
MVPVPVVVPVPQFTVPEGGQEQVGQLQFGLLVAAALKKPALRLAARLDAGTSQHLLKQKTTFADPGHFGVDPDLDPRIHASD